MHRHFVRALQASGFWLACTVPIAAQTPAAVQATPPGYTLHVSSRLVLTDVTVTDQGGNPVHNLARSAFEILDNGKPQGIASFSEHTAAEKPQPGPPPIPGEFSNSFLQNPPPAFNVLLLDITTIRITDQMYLAEQLKKFVAALPPDGMLAVYLRAGDHVALLQDFTSDRALLGTAVARAVPRLQQPGSWAASDLDTLQQMLTFLKPYPGRKNLIWFSGGSNLGLMTDATQLPVFVDMRPLYDALESTRIAVYPVDARGLTVAEPGGRVWQQMMMEQTAQATGGHAFYNDNGLKQIAARIVNDGSDFYTLSYYPHDPKFDNKWHKVKVQLQAGGEPYQLSYRRGYFDDGSNQAPSSGERIALRADGSTRRVSPDVLKSPIIFSATVQPATPRALSVSGDAETTPPRKNQTTYLIHYSVRATDVVQQIKDGKPQVMLDTGVLAVNRLGTHVARQAKSVQVNLDPDKLRAHPDGNIGFQEQINLPRGEDFLYIMVWDKESGRFGTLQAPVTVAKRAQQP